LIFCLLLLLILTAILNTAEMAMFSARPERMRQAMEAGNKSAVLVLAYQRSPASFLTAGQLIGTAISFGIGAILQGEYAGVLVPWLDSFLQWDISTLETISAAIMVTVVSIIAMIFTNVIPKQIGYDYAEEIALLFARPFRFLTRITRPLTWLVARTTRITKSLAIKRSRRARVTEDDILSLLSEGVRLGSINEQETQFVRNALHLSELKVRDVMRPSSEIEAIDINWPQSKIEAKIKGSKHSHLPVYKQSITQPLGLLKVRDWLLSENKELNPFLHPLSKISEEETAVELFTALRDAESRAVLVTDKANGNVIGMITLNDAVQLLAGDLKPIHDE
jgi:putative hemolysin